MKTLSAILGHVPAATTLDRLVEMVPDAVDKVSAFFSKKAEERKAEEEDF